MTAKLFRAFCALCALIDEGVEYPDAEFRVCRKYGVDATALRERYDAEFDDLNEERA